MAGKRISAFDRLMDEMIAAYLSSGPSSDELERAEAWKNLPEGEHGRVLSGLLGIASAIPNPFPKRDMYPGLLRLSPTFRALYGKHA